MGLPIRAQATIATKPIATIQHVLLVPSRPSLSPNLSPNRCLPPAWLRARQAGKARKARRARQARRARRSRRARRVKRVRRARRINRTNKSRSLEEHVDDALVHMERFAYVVSCFGSKYVSKAK